ncbi:tRNA (adenosine(37)-N6)-threonylcarbamoyltransferase complex ATPase subunit type 1 TsaE [bacterium]|nr:tRNA (adenosine(37)-N6)-threonylcarbamoyltransferase complex ATPase subunit type 1 TsaE [bacterium]
MNIITKSPEQTKKIAENFAKKLKGGEIIGLTGPLGSGKTVFVQGLAKGLKIKEKITSPSFVLMKFYKTNKKAVKQLIHLDAWRLNSPQDLEQLGITELLTEDNVIVIEWIEKVEKFFKNKSLIIIKFTLGQQEKTRKISIKNKKV